jgi:hypothetical protein
VSGCDIRNEIRMTVGFLLCACQRYETASLGKRVVTVAIDSFRLPADSYFGTRLRPTSRPASPSPSKAALVGSGTSTGSGAVIDTAAPWVRKS